MYSNKPVVDTESLRTELPATNDSEKRIKQLEDRVRLLGEQVHKLASALELNSRQIRRQNTDIHNVNTVLKNRS